MNRHHMDTHNFMLILDGPIDEATSDLLFEAGLDDAAITAFDGHPALDVDREDPHAARRHHLSSHPGRVRR